jgi:hypothetical protein
VCTVRRKLLDESSTVRRKLLASNYLLTVHTSCHPTLQHHRNYNRTENQRQ